VLLTGLGEAAAQPRVGGHAAADRHPAQALLLGAAHRLAHELVDDGLLVGGGDRGAQRLAGRLRLVLAQVVQQGRLQAAEAEVEALRQAARKGHRRRLATRRQQVELATAGVGQAQQTGALVEGLAGGVVERAPDDAELHSLLDHRQQRVAAARRQTDERRLDAQRVAGRQMALQVVDRRERQTPRVGNGLRGGEAHEQGADQARTGRDRDALEVVPGRPGLGEGVGHGADQQLGVAPRGDLGHDPAEGGVELVLRRDDRRTDDRATRATWPAWVAWVEGVEGVDHGRAGVVARSLDAQQQGHAESPSRSFHMIRASSRLSE